MPGQPHANLPCTSTDDARAPWSIYIGYKAVNSAAPHCNAARAVDYQEEVAPMLHQVTASQLAGTVHERNQPKANVFFGLLVFSVWYFEDSASYLAVMRATVACSSSLSSAFGQSLMASMIPTLVRNLLHVA